MKKAKKIIALLLAMKKKIVIILLLCSICLGICACNMNAPNEVNQSDSIEQQIANPSAGNNQHDAESLYTGEQQNEIIKPQEGERPLLTFESENEYAEFLDLNEMPNNFVTYDEIKTIGIFECLVFLSDAYAEDYSSYMYSLVDSEGFGITLYVDHNQGVLSNSDSVSNLHGTNMRMLSDTRSGVFISEGLKYQYISGELFSISWKTQNINYTLCAFGEAMLSKYPISESTFVGKMLNSNTSTQAFDTVFDKT